MNKLLFLILLIALGGAFAFGITRPDYREGIFAIGCAAFMGVVLGLIAIFKPWDKEDRK